MKRPSIPPMFLLLIFVPLTVLPTAAEEKPVPIPRLRPAGIDGTLMICGGEPSDGLRDRFTQLAGGEKAKLVLLLQGDDTEKRLQLWKGYKPTSVVLLEVRSRKMADDAEILKPVREATGIWLDGAAYPGTALERELNAMLKRGGIVGGTAAFSRRMLAGEDAKTIPGFDLLPGTVIAPHFNDNHKKQLLHVLDKNPGLVGLSIGEGAALIIKGREMRVRGAGAVSVCLAASPTRPARTIELKAGGVSDFTMWRRAARARSEPTFPPAKAPVPEVPRGALVIVGGGGMPVSVIRKFIELAGGPDAPIVVLPTAQPDPIPARSGAAMFEKNGAKNVRVLSGRDLKDVEDPRNLEILRKAKGIWFGGGRQWRFMDAYEGTKAEPLIRDVLRRGGVIGGSSAGASIQADYLARGSPLNNTDMMCEGYERGLDFLPGVAVDQHFSRRNRFADMTALTKTYPQLLGIGIDEATALVVQGHIGEVLGRGKVYFYNRRKPIRKDAADYQTVESGRRYDLKARKVLPARETK